MGGWVSAETALRTPLALLPVKKGPHWGSRGSCLLSFHYSGLKPWEIMEGWQKLPVQMQGALQN